MDNLKIGQRLRELRGDKTQKNVAKDLGISVSALSMYEQGNRIPRDELKIRIASFYNVPIDIFFSN